MEYLTNARTIMLRMAPKKVPAQFAFFTKIPKMNIPAIALPKSPITSWNRKNKDFTGKAAIRHAISVPKAPTTTVVHLAILNPLTSE